MQQGFPEAIQRVLIPDQTIQVHKAPIQGQIEVLQEVVIPGRLQVTEPPRTLQKVRPIHDLVQQDHLLLIQQQGAEAQVVIHLHDLRQVRRTEAIHLLVLPAHRAEVIHLRDRQTLQAEATPVHLAEAAVAVLRGPVVLLHGLVAVVALPDLEEGKRLT